MSTPVSPLEQLEQQTKGTDNPAPPSAPSSPSAPSMSPLEQLEQQTNQPPKSDGPQGANIQPVTTSTNPKLAVAASAENMPEYVGATGAVGAGAMGASVMEPVISAAIAHLGGLSKIVQAAKTMGLVGFGIKEAHDVYKMVSGAHSK